MTHLFSVDKPKPKSDATCFLESPLLSATGTASCRKAISSSIAPLLLFSPDNTRCRQQSNRVQGRKSPTLNLSPQVPDLSGLGFQAQHLKMYRLGIAQILFVSCCFGNSFQVENVFGPRQRTARLALVNPCDRFTFNLRFLRSTGHMGRHLSGTRHRVRIGDVLARVDRCIVG